MIDASEGSARVARERPLAGDSAFVVHHAGRMSEAWTTANTAEAQLAAGQVNGRLHLAAYALGGSACGMTFYDSEIAGLLREPLDALLLTCVGVPSYTGIRGGAPGSPAAIRVFTKG
jgi:hypothetical protein